jgi:hypothetical protein
MTIKQINHQQSEKLPQPAVSAEMADELLEEALLTLTPELEEWRDRRGNKDHGTLRLVMRIHETRCSLAWIELQAWSFPSKLKSIRRDGIRQRRARALNNEDQSNFPQPSRHVRRTQSGKHSDPAD